MIITGVRLKTCALGCIAGLSALPRKGYSHFHLIGLGWSFFWEVLLKLKGMEQHLHCAGHLLEYPPPPGDAIQEKYKIPASLARPFASVDYCVSIMTWMQCLATTRITNLHTTR